MIRQPPRSTLFPYPTPFRSSLGGQLFWAGLVPALVGLPVAAVVLGAGWWAIAGFLLAYNAVRLWTAYWSLRTGLTAGMRVGAAIDRKSTRLNSSHANISYAV